MGDRKECVESKVTEKTLVEQSRNFFQEVRKTRTVKSLDCYRFIKSPLLPVFDDTVEAWSVRQKLRNTTADLHVL